MPINVDFDNNALSKRDQIGSALKLAIESGQLPEGSPMPPTRELAKRLGVSRDTIVRTYADLQNQCYIDTYSTRGFYVRKFPIKNSPSHQLDAAEELSPEIELRLSSYAQRCIADKKIFPFSPDFDELNYGGPPQDLLPKRRWHNHIQNCARSNSQLNYQPQIFGQLQLRQAITGYLNRNKQVNCTTDQVVIFSNTLTATNLLCRLLLEPGDYIAVEEPGYGGIRNTAASLGANILGIPVDKEGIVIEDLEARKDFKIKLIYVTPNHHDPTGVIMSLKRRKELLVWARDNDAWIIEDDYDGHFQYDRTPLTSLKSLDQDGRVLYISTFWKILYPLSGIGFCVLPEPLLPVVRKTKIEADGLSEVITQQALAAIINEGYLEKHIRRTQDVYRKRRSTLIFNLKLSLGDAVDISRDATGTDIFVRFLKDDPNHVLAAGNSVGLRFVSTINHYFSSPPVSEFILDFSCLNETKIQSMVTHFAARLNKARQSGDLSLPQETQNLAVDSLVETTV